MIKKISIIVLTFLFISCSDIGIKNESEREKKIEILSLKLADVKKEIEKANLLPLKEMLDLSLIKQYQIEKILNLVPNDIKFYYTTPIFENNKIKNIVGIGWSERVFYLEIVYSYKNNDWKIIDIKEKGD